MIQPVLCDTFLKLAHSLTVLFFGRRVSLMYHASIDFILPHSDLNATFSLMRMSEFGPLCRLWVWFLFI